MSTPELDALVEPQRRRPGCYGARLTGAGFGGCVVALVGCDARIDRVIADVAENTIAPGSGRESTAIVSRAAAGARLVSS